MTSIPPAEPRPPSLSRRPTDSNRPSLSRPSSQVISPIDKRSPAFQRQIGDHADGRPAKRRKVEGDGTNPRGHAPSNSNGSAIAPATSPASQIDFKASLPRLVKPSAVLVRFGKAQGKEDEDDLEILSDDDVPELPARPWSTNPPSKPADNPAPTHRSRVNLPVPNTPDSLETPASAPHFVAKRPAGFFPWTGKHPEDVLSENNVKHGYFDKPPNPTEKELNTARVPLYNAFKHKSGVDNLSILFSLVLDQKNQHGLISSVSTFKPPPRVTLTEAKRKSWIADLANADVPLRRLSRTIPQGIRGQSLLDQCLQNAVPLSRAIWFAKCVCANEIRTLRRKGTTPSVAVGTESKWLREWTVHVEQFLEAHVEQRTIPDWKSNIQYALRLITRLYLESLLDRDHYLDWIVQSFASADIDHTPFWLMIVHLYKQDMSCHRRRGKKLAEALIDKYQSLEKPLGHAIVSLKQRLREAIRWLLLSRPASFLMPDKWPAIVGVVRTCLDKEIRQDRQILGELDRINGRTMGFNKSALATSRAPDQAVVEILDSAQAPFNVTKLEEDLTLACPDADLRIPSCLEWACTRFRCGSARIYLVSRLIRRWRRDGQDVDSVILNFLSASREGRTTADGQRLKHLAAQLSRSDSFPVSKYLQWLMVRGLPKKGTVEINIDSIFGNAAAKGESESSKSTLVLLDMSMHLVEDHVVNLRNSVLRRAGFDPDYEEAIFRKCVSFIERQLAALGPARKAPPSRDSEPAFGLLPWTLRSKIAMWLRSKVADSVATTGSGTQPAPVLLGSKTLKEEQFFFVRHVLECMGDEAVLADVVGILSCSQNDDLVASLAATIHFHADSFSAIGALDILQKRMCQLYLTWRATKPTMPLLTTSLLDLCTAFPLKSPAIKLLQQDLVRGDRGRAVAACSPYSDGIAESLQQAGATFVEDFEAILQSEPNMNELTMNGLFAVLADRMEKQQKFGDDLHTILSFCQLLSRLRLCRRTQADLLIQRWVSRLIPYLDGNFGCILLRNLIGTGCLSFAGLLTAMTSSKPASRKYLAVTALLQHILAPKQVGLADWVTYQTRTRWFDYSQREPKIVVEMLCEAGLESVSSLFEARLLSVLVNDGALSSTTSDLTEQWLVSQLNHVLDCRDDNISGFDLRALLGSINNFSHRFVQLRFWLLSRGTADKGLATDQGEMVDVLSETLEQTLESANGTHGSDSRFSQLLDTVGSDVANQVRHRVEGAFIEVLPKFPLNKAASPVTAMFPPDVQQLSLIIERAFRVCTTSTVPKHGLVSQLIDKLSQILKYLGSTNVPSIPAASIMPGNSGSSTGMNPPQMVSVTSSPVAYSSESVNVVYPTAMLSALRYMLQMICLQRPALLSSGGNATTAKQAQSEQVQLLVRLGQIAVHPAIGNLGSREEQSKAQEVTGFIFDVIGSIVDEVSEEVKTTCAKMLKDKLQDVRLKYLFGSINMMGSEQVPDMGHGLQVVKEGKGVVGDWRPRVWEVLDNGSGKESETSLGLGLFGARYG